MGRNRWSFLVLSQKIFLIPTLKLISYSRKKPLFYSKTQGRIALGSLAAVALSVMQDLIHAFLNGHAFYLSEVLLFESFWLLFFPISLTQLILLNKKGQGLLGSVFITLGAFIGHVLFFPVVVHGCSALLMNHTFPFSRMLTYTLGEDAYVCLLIYGTLGLAFRRKPTFTPALKEKISGELSQRLIVKQGRKNVTLLPNQIVYIRAASPYVSLHTTLGKFLQKGTLKSMAGQLEQNQFMRIHKSTIVNLRWVSSYVSRLNGDYDLHLENGETIRLSRNYAARFKQRFASPPLKP